MPFKINKKRIKEDKNEFRNLYDHYFPEAMNVALAMTRNRELAKEAVQETFIRVYKNIDSYHSDRPFSPWFFRILSNECIRILQKETKLLKQVAYIGDYDNEFVKKEQADISHVHEAIQSLHDDYRIPIILKYVKGFTEKEIASILNMNQNTVKTRLYKGREQIKNHLTEYDIKEGNT